MTRDDKEDPHTGVDYYLQHTYIRSKRNKSKKKILYDNFARFARFCSLSVLSLTFFMLLLGADQDAFFSSTLSTLRSQQLRSFCCYCGSILRCRLKLWRWGRESLVRIVAVSSACSSSCCCESLAAALPLQQFPNQYVDTRGWGGGSRMRRMTLHFIFWIVALTLSTTKCFTTYTSLPVPLLASARTSKTKSLRSQPVTNHLKFKWNQN